MKIYYVTSNNDKIKLAKMIFKDLDVEIIKEDIEIPEIQSLDCNEVAKYSAEYAAKLLNKPVLKNDSSLVIPALKGFPGALAKYAEDTIGADGYIKLLDGLDRKCYWVESLAYAEPDGDTVCFTSLSYGRIADKVYEGRGYPFDKIFIPDKDTRTFSCMSEEEQLKTFDTSAYLKLYEYIKTKNSV